MIPITRYCGACRLQAQLYAVQVQVKTVFNTYRRDQLDSHRLSHPVLV